jgi:hypothetical protein
MERRTLLIGSGIGLAAVLALVGFCAAIRPDPEESASAPTASVPASPSTPAPPPPGSAPSAQLSPELRAFDTWLERALAVIAKNPAPTREEAPHPVLGTIRCHTQKESPSYGLCTSTRIVRRGRTKSVYSAKWKRDDPSVWTAATTARHMPSLDCSLLAPGQAAEIRRLRDGSGTRLHCKLSPTRQALISQYASASAHRKTNLAYFSPSFPQHQPGFQRLLTPGPHR